MLNDAESQQIKELIPWFGRQSPPPGWMEINDADARFRGDIVAADGFFSGTVNADRLDLLTKLNIREGAVSSYLVVGRSSATTMDITIPAHWQNRASFVDFDIPLITYSPGIHGGQLTEQLNIPLDVNISVDGSLIGTSRSGLVTGWWGKPTKCPGVKDCMTTKKVPLETRYGVSLRYFHFQPITKDTHFNFTILGGSSRMSGSFTSYGAAGIRVR